MSSDLGGFWPVLSNSAPPPHPRNVVLTPVLSQPENLAGCDFAERGNTFQAYHGVKALEEPIGGQLTAQSLLPAATQNKKSPLRGEKNSEKMGGGWIPFTNWPQVALHYSGAVLPHEDTVVLY